jgi:hypothetical protein
VCVRACVHARARVPGCVYTCVRCLCTTLALCRSLSTFFPQPSLAALSYFILPLSGSPPPPLSISLPAFTHLSNNTANSTACTTIVSDDYRGAK